MGELKLSSRKLYQGRIQNDPRTQLECVECTEFRTSFGGSGGGRGGPARLGGGRGVAGSSGAKAVAFSAPASGGGKGVMGTKGATPQLAKEPKMHGSID